MSSQTPHFVIIGGGITGLSAAFQLETLTRDCGKSCKITLLEATHRIGGKLLSERVDEFVVDAGPDVFMAKKPHGVALCHAVGLKDQLQETDPNTRATYIREGKSLIPISMYEDEPLATLRHGIQSLADATENALQTTEVHRNIRVDAITSSNNGFTIHTTCKTSNSKENIPANAVIIAIPASATANILRELVPSSSNLFSTVSYTQTTTVSVAYHKSDVPNALNGYGYIVRNPTPGNVSACTWSSSKIRGRAPEDSVLIRAFIRGTGIPTANLESAVSREFRDTLGISAAPLFMRIYEWPEAIPVYEEHHPQNIEALDKLLREFSGLIVAGSAIHATGIPDSIRTGTDAANVAWSQVVDGAAVESPIHKTDMGANSVRSFFAR